MDKKELLRCYADHWSFGGMRVVFQTDGSGDKNETSSLIFKNLGGCYPFEIYKDENGDVVEVVFNGVGERGSVLQCLYEILLRLKEKGWIHEPNPNIDPYIQFLESDQL